MEQTFSMAPGVLRCRQAGDRVELVMERPGPGEGLYRGYVQGAGGELDLGTLLPEGGCLRLRRTVPVETLRRRGCWPVTGGRATLSFPFAKAPAGPPRGWRETCRGADRFSRDPVLAQGAREAGRALECQRGDGIFCLAWPWDPGRPFPLAPAFCLAQVKGLGGRRYVVYHFSPEGRPLLPEEAAGG